MRDIKYMNHIKVIKTKTCIYLQFLNKIYINILNAFVVLIIDIFNNYEFYYRNSNTSYYYYIIFCNNYVRKEKNDSKFISAKFREKKYMWIHYRKILDEEKI